MTRLFSALLLLPLSLLAQIIPTSPQTTCDWTRAGIPGGIPYRTTTNTVLPAGSSLSAINSAILNCPSNQVVVLSPGTYNINGVIAMNNNGVTLRGGGASGPNATILNSCSFVWEYNNNYPYKNYNPVNLNSGYTQGSTSLTCASASGMAVGDLVGILQNNVNITSGGVQGCASCQPSLNGNQQLQQYFVITGIAGNTLTVSDPVLSYLWTNTASPVIYDLGSYVTMAGVEDMRLEGDGGGFGSGTGIDMECASYCWARNIYVHNAFQYGIMPWGTVHCEIRHCTIDTMGSGPANSPNCYGLYLRWSSFGLIEDNIITAVPNDAWEAASGCSFCYNFFTNCVYNPTYWLGETAMHHGGFPNYNLWEGNYWGNWLADNIKTAGGYSTLLRNRINGWEPTKTGGTYAIALYPNNWYINILGNIFGSANYHTVYQDAGQGGEIYAVTANDPNAIATFIISGNYDTVTPGLVWSSNPSRSIPTSLAKNSKPANFGILNWPPYDSTTANAGNVNANLATNIPAGYRFWLGADPPSGAPPPASPTPPANFRNVFLGKWTTQ